MNKPDLQASGGKLHAGMWLKIGLISFGGPAAHIALIQTEVCERRKLASQQSFMRGLNFAMLLPGPEAQQLATYLGWRIGGIPGGLVAGLGFVLPGAVFMIAATIFLALSGDVPFMQAIFKGVQPVIVALVAYALYNIGRRALTAPAAIAIAVLAFVAGQFLGISFPVIALVAALVSLAIGKLRPDESEKSEDELGPAPRRKRRAVIIFGTGIGLWCLITAMCAFLLPAEPFLGIARLITTAALVTFGGAYAVIAYVGEQAATTMGWVSKTALLDGLAVAETIPGPLVLFNTYIATLAGNVHGIAGAITGGALAVFYTFLPSLTVVLAGAPFVERIYAIAGIRAALSGISAAVVGVIAKLALFLLLAVCFPGGEPSWTSLAITIATGIAVWSGKVPALALIIAGGLTGILVSL
ncbi:MAG: chromate efflux transporter [Hyphomicrobiales bacterium]